VYTPGALGSSDPNDGKSVSAGALSVAFRDILGHRPKNMTEGYTHATPEAMAAAVEMVARYDHTVRNYGRITA
jgi:hypothetical protein